MSPWVSLMLDVCMAALMAALIFYCVKLNARLSRLRSQDAEIRDLIAGLRDASERAEVSVQRLKAAGLAAERSLRGAIEDAARARTELAAGASAAAAPKASAKPADRIQSAPPRSGSASAASRAPHEKRDMLMTAVQSGAGNVPAPPAPSRPRTREEAEESVIQAIRSARGEA